MLLTTIACLFGALGLSLVLAALFLGRRPRSDKAADRASERIARRPIPEFAQSLPFDRRLPDRRAPDWRDRPGPLMPAARRSPDPQRIRQS